MREFLKIGQEYPQYVVELHPSAYGHADINILTVLSLGSSSALIFTPIRAPYQSSHPQHSGAMHPRNRYKHSKPDFGELGEFYSSLKPHLIQRSRGSGKPTDPPRPPLYTLDFSKPEVLRELTCAILARDFGIKLEIPLDKLIPAVPQRLNYVHWIEDLLSDEGGGAYPTGSGVTGIDIGRLVGGKEWGGRWLGEKEGCERRKEGNRGIGGSEARRRNIHSSSSSLSPHHLKAKRVRKEVGG